MSMTCFEFRRQVGAEPATRDAGVLGHQLECRACAEFLREQQRLDRVLDTALRVPVPEQLPARIRWKTANQSRPWHRSLGMAATILLSLGLGFGIWTASERTVLAHEVVAHIQHEPALLLDTTSRADGRKVNAVVERSGLGLGLPLEDVVHAGLCPFRGRLVPHLVVAVDGEPVSVLLLRNVRSDDVRPIHDDGFNGILVPTDYGSMAIVAARPDLVAPVRAQLERAVSHGI